MKNKFNVLHTAVKIALTSTATAGLLLSQSVYAADESQDNKAEENIEKIAVVGTRGAPRSIDDSPVPVDVIGGDELSKSGNTDMLEVLKSTVPAFSVQTNPISDAASFIRPANLRGLPADSTLILVNGKRRHRSSVIALQGAGINDGAHGADISVIPSAALKQVEILRDGAAAQYGSDAIAGVINFVLNDSDEGGSISARTSEYYEGDGRSFEVSGNIGLPLTDDGFANLSFQYKNADATDRSVQRPDAAAMIAEGNTAVKNPAQVWGSPEIKDDLTLFINSGIQINDETQVYAFGNYSDREVTGGYYFRNPLNRGGVFGDGNGNLLVGDLTADGSGNCPVVPVTDNNVLNDPAYLAMAANPNCFSFNSMFPGGFTPQFTGKIEDSSFVAGIKGEFSGIDYDVSLSTGQNESGYWLRDTVNASLGPASPTDFYTGSHIQKETALNIDLVKDIDVTSIEFLVIAGGFEYRDESFEVIAGQPESYAKGNLFEQGFSDGSNGFPGFKPEAAGKSSRSNSAVYVDVEAQYTADFLMTYAVRYENYDSFGSDTNYKVAAQYSVTDDFSLRSSLSTGFRAPTVGQENYRNVQTALDGGVLIDSALIPSNDPIAVALGATELTPEESESFAIGAVWNVSDIHLTLDLYQIDVTDRISQSDKFPVDSNDPSKGKVSFFTNDFDTKTSGLDFVAGYRMALFGGDASFNLAYNYNKTEVTNQGKVTTDFKVSRIENDIPKHKGTLAWTQSWDSFSMLARANYFGEFQGVHADWDSTANDVDAAVTVDLDVTYYLTEDLSVSVGAQNLFDKYPNEVADFVDGGEILPGDLLGAKYYETSPFGFNGGSYYLRATYNF
ncbi:TonB-dependent receptor plug domain-containing protein [Pseudoalteromonas denitrificans]|uniref:Iron complex outermembrane recepter protein n=1 Tax=Pseudoalteromonas denitrificans DSM 6059 TaxID=1123010 RepID=A0A1I1FGQ3_9GAMM|nr:TonB-dependent receptor [Pseudoalteromonas denitrificans]SFB98116.1 iron complex outermembrane recepter protein [Pseudoalteromonas denitrificans DSM 6059]